MLDDIVDSEAAPISAAVSDARGAPVGLPAGLGETSQRGCPGEGRRSALAGLLLRCYNIGGSRIRALVHRAVLRLEGGEWYSLTLRQIFTEVHQIEVGLYTHGGCFILGHMPPGTRIGRYSSIAASASVFGRNHPLNLRSSHAFFFNPRLGIVGKEIISFGRLTIGHDVWIGHNAIIMPSVRSIAVGAVIAAGAVVHKDVPPYAVVAGNPGRVVHYRFSAPVIADLLASRWWDRSIAELRPLLREFQRPLEGGPIR